MTLAPLAIALLPLAAQLPVEPSLRASSHLVVSVNHGAFDGALSLLDSAPPWSASPDAGAVGPDAVVHVFHGELYVLSRRDRVLEIFDPRSLKVLDTLDLGAVSAPRDVVIVRPGLGLISDNDSTHLWWIDTSKGDIWPGPDLSAHADPDGLPDIERMLLAGAHVYVQMQRFDRNDHFTEYGAKLAVLGPAANPSEPLALEDVIDLQGIRPNYRMQVSAAGDRLWVSAPGVDNDWGYCDCGLEEVDLVHRVSLGLLLAEDDISADLSAFVMVDRDKGFAIVHTSIVASTHLRVFDRGGGANEIHMAFGRLETIAFDPLYRQIFFPEPDSGAFRGGVRIFDSDGDFELSGRIELGGAPFDMVVLR